jgi:hypothetical protein
MYFGDEATITADGLIVRSGLTRPLGIYDGSCCWGTWVYDARNAGDLPHFLISPINPRCWLRTFRIDIKLRHEPGAMRRAAERLAEHADILFADCAPTGHHHATWNVIAELTDLDDGDATKKLERLNEKASDRHVIEALDTYINRDVLQAKRTIEEALDPYGESAPVGEDGEAFLYDKSRQSVIYDADNGDYGKVTRRRVAVRVDWMENLAVFRAYSLLKKSSGFVRLVYDARTSRFTSDGSPTFLESLEECAEALKSELPVATIASFDLEDRTIRTAVSMHDVKRTKISVRIPYRISGRGGSSQSPDEKEKKSKGTQGLIRDLCKEFENVNLLQVNNSVTEHQDLQERGFINFLASPSGSSFESIVTAPLGSPKQVDSINRLQARLAEVKVGHGSKLTRQPVIALHDVHRLFVSTKASLLKRRPDVWQGLQDLAGRYGFKTSSVLAEGIERAHERASGKSHLDDQVIGKIEAADAFLQLWPVVSGEPELEAYQWLHWELGIALGAKKIAVVCYDTMAGQRVPDWAQKAAHSAGLFGHEFDSSAARDQILREIEPGIRELAVKVRAWRA